MKTTLSLEEIPGTVELKISGNPGYVDQDFREGLGKFSIAVHGGSTDFYWNSPKRSGVLL